MERKDHSSGGDNQEKGIRRVGFEYKNGLFFTVYFFWKKVTVFPVCGIYRYRAETRSKNN